MHALDMTTTNKTLVGMPMVARKRTPRLTEAACCVLVRRHELEAAALLKRAQESPGRSETKTLLLRQAEESIRQAVLLNSRVLP